MYVIFIFLSLPEGGVLKMSPAAKPPADWEFSRNLGTHDYPPHPNPLQCLRF